MPARFTVRQQGITHDAAEKAGIPEVCSNRGGRPVLPADAARGRLTQGPVGSQPPPPFASPSVPQVQLLQEPVAAALAYGINGGTDGDTVLVFDVGGGTFDVRQASGMERSAFQLLCP